MFLSFNTLPAKSREVHSIDFAISKDTTLCSDVQKNNKAVISLSLMYTTSELEETETVKLEIITFYNNKMCS